MIDIEFFILCFSSLFALINPIGNVPIFITLTENYTQKERSVIALKSIIFSFIVLIIFAMIGELIFSFYGITIHAFRIAGGILLFKISLDMVESKDLELELHLQKWRRLKKKMKLLIHLLEYH